MTDINNNFAALNYWAPLKTHFFILIHHKNQVISTVLIFK